MYDTDGAMPPSHESKMGEKRPLYPTRYLILVACRVHELNACSSCLR